MSRKHGQPGFTLVELMIAIGLMLIITLQLNIIFNQSRKMFLAADAMVQVFQNARSALDLMERDISNVQKTSQMEFFKDNRTRPDGCGYGIFNEGEELHGNEPDGIAPRFFNGLPYSYSMSLKREEYEPKDRRIGGKYRKDSLYFRTVTSIDGKPKEALVLYELDTGQTNNIRPRPILRRTLWEIDKLDAQGVPKIKKHDAMDLCYYVDDFRVELYYRDKRARGIGQFYDAKEATTSPPAGDTQPPNLKRYGSGESYGVMCVAKNEPLVYAPLSTSDDPKVGAVLTLQNIPLGPVAPGDEMYLISKPDPTSNACEDFGGPVTISKIDATTQGVLKIHFDQAPFMINKLGAMRSQGIPQLDVDWRAGWLPPALRVRMKVKDSRSEELRTIERVFQILKS